MSTTDVVYIDGFLRALECGCHGCNYVPFYGAESFVHTGESIIDSLKQHLGKQTPIMRRPRGWADINNFSYIDKNWKEKLADILSNWIDSKSKFDNGFKETYKDDLLEIIEEIVGKDPVVFTTNIEHEKFELCNETIGFIGNDMAFYMHFSFSD